MEGVHATDTGLMCKQKNRNPEIYPKIPPKIDIKIAN